MEEEVIGEMMHDFVAKRPEYRELASLKSKVRKVPVRVLNRRYKKLQEVNPGNKLMEGDYFSEEEIKRRNPILYQIYLGRYVRTGPAASSNFYDLLMKQVQNKEDTELIESIILEHPSWEKHLKPVDKELTPEEQSDNEDELITISHHLFLAGLDSKFIDYNLIDNNE